MRKTTFDGVAATAELGIHMIRPGSVADAAPDAGVLCAPYVKTTRAKKRTAFAELVAIGFAQKSAKYQTKTL